MPKTLVTVRIIFAWPIVLQQNHPAFRVFFTTRMINLLEPIHSFHSSCNAGTHNTINFCGRFRSLFWTFGFLKKQKLIDKWTRSIIVKMAFLCISNKRCSFFVHFILLCLLVCFIDFSKLFSLSLTLPKKVKKEINKKNFMKWFLGQARDSYSMLHGAEPGNNLMKLSRHISKES